MRRVVIDMAKKAVGTAAKTNAAGGGEERSKMGYSQLGKKRVLGPDGIPDKQHPNVIGEGRAPRRKKR